MAEVAKWFRILGDGHGFSERDPAHGPFRPDMPANIGRRVVDDGAVMDLTTYPATVATTYIQCLVDERDLAALAAYIVDEADVPEVDVLLPEMIRACGDDLEKGVPDFLNTYADAAPETVDALLTQAGARGLSVESAATLRAARVAPVGTPVEKAVGGDASVSAVTE